MTAVLYGGRTALLKARPADLKLDIVKGDNGADVPQLLLPDTLRSMEIRSLKFH